MSCSAWAVVLLAGASLLGCGRPGASRQSGHATVSTVAATVVTAPTASTSATPAAPQNAVGGGGDLPLSSLSAQDEARIDAAVEEGITAGEYPGAVVVIVRRDRVVLRKAYGARSLEPSRVAMSADTIFDLASLTKPIVSATSVFLLLQSGALKLDDPLIEHLPELGAEAAAISVRQLLSHTSGLPAANALRDYAEGREPALRRLVALATRESRGQRLYSDLGYILLGELVARVAGEPLERFAQRHVFAPLGMDDTGFALTDEQSRRAAPTERRDGKWLRGQVHDPRAAALGGVAGHAGLFSSGDDLARFATMLLQRGLVPPILLSTQSIDLLTEPATPSASNPSTFSLGFQLLDGGYGHTGFTGTSLWLDPNRGTAIILLTSRLHAHGKGSATRLRRAVREVVLAADRRQPPVRVGIDEIATTGFALLHGRKVGLVTHAAAVAADGRRTVDVLMAAPEVELVALLSPEHGLSGQVDGEVADAIDADTGLPIRSLYGPRRRPSRADLADIDTLVVDLQDAGARFYTYATTLGYLLEAAADQHLRVVVLDRPNPIDGVHVAGPLRDADRESFVAYHTIPVRHGLTVGELARLYAHERGLDVDLVVVPMRGWRRQERFAQTGLSWRAPSPNLTSPAAASLYPGIALLELTNVSVGRGTDHPFQRIGAPWLDPERLLAAVDRAALVGVEATATTFAPSRGPHAGVRCRGVALRLTDAERLDPVRVGLALASALRRTHPAWQPAGVLTLLGNRRAFRALVRGDDLPAIEAGWQAQLEDFRARRQPILLY